MKTIDEKAGDYFKNNPGTAELFGTSDGTLFLKKKDANVHAKSLEDDEVEVFKAKKAETIKHVLTQEDLDANPDLVEQGLQVGDEIKIDAPAVEETKGKKSNKRKKA